MAKLTSKQRGSLPTGDFAEPSDRKYPINDKSHAKNALARVSQHGTPEEKSEVRSAVHRKYPKIGKKSKQGKTRVKKSVGKRTSRKRA